MSIEIGSVGRAWRVDRYLCSNVWLSPRSARNVYGELVRPGLCAIEPAYGVDLVALTRHAAAAYRHDVRDAITPIRCEHSPSIPKATAGRSAGPGMDNRPPRSHTVVL